MSKKKILIIGNNLYSYLLSYFFIIKNYNVTIIHSQKKNLQTFNHLKIKKNKINNGFHALDYPRCNDLIKLLKFKFQIKLIKKKKVNKILIDNYLINQQDNIEKWPEALKKDLKNSIISDRINLNHIYKNKLLQIFKKCTERFNKFEPDTYAYLFTKWFIPNNFKIKSNDEGDKFRIKFKKNASFFMPQNLLFETLQIIPRILKKKKLKLFKNQDIQITKNIIYSSKKKFVIREFDKIYLSELTGKTKQEVQKILLTDKNTIKEHYNILFKVKEKIPYFTEILCANKKFYYINRISFYERHGQYIQVELFKDKTINLDVEKISNFIKQSLKLNRKPRYIGKISNRKIFFLSNSSNSKIRKKYVKFNKLLNKKIIFKKELLLPINMNKHFLYAKQDSNKI